MRRQPGIAPSTLIRWCFVACAFWCLAGAAFAAVRAFADEPSPYKPPETVYVEPSVEPKLSDCPELPEPLDASGEEYSDELLELRWVRIDAIKTCRALADRSDLIAKRVWWAVVEAAEGRGQRAITNAKLTELLESSCGKPCAVSVTADELGEGQTAELVSSIDASGEATKAALYIVCGLLVGGFIGAALWKTTHRGV